MATALLLPAHALENIRVGGTTRTMISYAPKNLPEQRPLVIACHGANQDAAYLQGLSKWETVADTAKFVVVYANGVDKYWDISGQSDLKFMEVIIDTMYSRHHIDKSRVYLTGFSMGGMFTYYAASKMADKIAAFAPVSGYLMGGPNATSSRAVPILHTHGTADDVCSYSNVQSHIDAWVKFNGCETTPEIIKPYPAWKPNSPASMKRYKNGRDGVEVALLTLADKGHWWSMDTSQALTSEEVWNFCKRYSLNLTAPTVSFTSPLPGTAVTCFAPEGDASFPDLTLTAKASDPNGVIASVDFYDGTQLLGSVTEAPYSLVLASPQPGKHTLKAVATDNDGETATASAEVTLTVQQSGQLNLSQAFNEGGCVPSGWMTFDGSEQRVGYSNGYSLGCRILQMTGNPRGFNYGLYFRNTTGAAHEGYAKYAAQGSSAALMLTPGSYELRYKICNWNRSQFSPVTISVETADDGQAVASQSYTPTVNIGNSASNSFSGVVQKTFAFTIEQTAGYTLSFYTDDDGWADAIIGSLVLVAKEYGTPSALQAPQASPAAVGASTVYSLSGIQGQTSGGIILVRQDSKTRKVLMK